jgi:hypothetical protein
LWFLLQWRVDLIHARKALGSHESVCEDRAPLHKEPQIRYILLAYLRTRQNGYGSALAFYLANALLQTARRFEELIQLTWIDCQSVGKKSRLSGSRSREAYSRMCPSRF